MSSVTDIDGNIYDTVKIGNLFWTTSNLRVTRFNNGLPIDKNSGFCSYNYDDLISEKFGHLYSCGSIWHSNTAQTFDYQPEHHVIQSLLPPLGWEIPTLDDWISLKTTLGIGKPNLPDNCSYNYCSPEIEHAMKSIDSWEIGGNGSNEFKSLCNYLAWHGKRTRSGSLPHNFCWHQFEPCNPGNGISTSC